MKKRNFLGVVILAACINLVLMRVISACCIAMWIPTIFSGSAGGVLYEDDDLLEDFTRLTGLYAERSGVEVEMPKSIDEAVLVLDDSDIYHCYLFYLYNSKNRLYTLSNGDTMEYRDGWLITPDHQLYGLNVYGTREDVGGAEGRTAVGQFIAFEWSKNQCVYPTSVERVIQRKWPARLRILLFNSGVTYKTLVIMSAISDIIDVLIIILLFICITTRLIEIRRMKGAR